MDTENQLRACLNLTNNGPVTAGIDTEFSLEYDNTTGRYRANREDVSTMLHAILDRYEHLCSANPTLLSESTPTHYAGLIASAGDRQLCVTHELGPHIFFWLNSAMYTYGINTILDGEIHGVQRALYTPAMVLAAETALRELHKNHNH